MQNIILDTDIDVLRCYQCRELIDTNEPKIIVGYGSRGGAWAIWHPGCFRQLEDDLKASATGLPRTPSEMAIIIAQTAIGMAQ